MEEAPWPAAQRLDVCAWCGAEGALEEDGVQDEMELLLPVILRVAVDGT